MFLPTDITLRPGDTGDSVLALQERLAERDLLFSGNLNAFYDGPTEQAVRDFQGLNGLVTDGIAGPKTLRLLVTLGGLYGGSGGGGDTAASEQEEGVNLATDEAIKVNMAREMMAEQERIAQEAIISQQNQSLSSQQQLSELERSNRSYGQHHETILAQQAMQPMMQAPLKSLDEQVLYAREVMQPTEQLAFNKEGVKAATMADDLERQPKLSQPPKAEERAHEPVLTKEQGALSAQAAQGEAKTVAVRPEAGELAAGKEPQQHASQAEKMISAHTFHFGDAPAAQQEGALQAKASRNPELMRTEARLDSRSQAVSQQEGQQLDSRGVQNRGDVPMIELGQLSPDRTPGVLQERQIGLA